MTKPHSIISLLKPLSLFLLILCIALPVFSEEEEHEDDDAHEWLEEIEEIENFVQKHRPSFAAMLKDVKSHSLDAYEGIIEELAEPYEHIQDWAEEIEELKDDVEFNAKAELQEMNIQIQSHLEEVERRLAVDILAYKVKQGKANKAELEKAVRALFNNILAERERDLERTRSELNELETEIKKLRDNQEVIIKDKMDELTKESSLLDW